MRYNWKAYILFRFRVNSTRGQLDTCVELTACRVDFDTMVDAHRRSIQLASNVRSYTYRPNTFLTPLIVRRRPVDTAAPFELCCTPCRPWQDSLLNSDLAQIYTAKVGRGKCMCWPIETSITFTGCLIIVHVCIPVVFLWSATVKSVNVHP